MSDDPGTPDSRPSDNLVPGPYLDEDDEYVDTWLERWGDERWDDPEWVAAYRRACDAEEHAEDPAGWEAQTPSQRDWSWAAALVAGGIVSEEMLHANPDLYALPSPWPPVEEDG